MSRGFVKEDDQEEIPIVPPRADLPAGTENFVTPEGYSKLLEERELLLQKQEQLDKSQENEYRIAFNHLNARLLSLNERIASAKIIDPTKLPEGEVHFGSVVTFENTTVNTVQTFQITGVDEADISKKKIGFTTPLAQCLMRKKTGDKALLRLGNREMVLKILKIE